MVRLKGPRRMLRSYKRKPKGESRKPRSESRKPILKMHGNPSREAHAVLALAVETGIDPVKLAAN